MQCGFAQILPANNTWSGKGPSSAVIDTYANPLRSPCSIYTFSSQRQKWEYAPRLKSTLIFFLLGLGGTGAECSGQNTSNGQTEVKLQDFTENETNSSKDSHPFSKQKSVSQNKTEVEVHLWPLNISILCKKESPMGVKLDQYQFVLLHFWTFHYNILYISEYHYY